MKKDKQTFEEYLKAKHTDDYMGTNDDMQDAFDTWLENLDTSDVMMYAETYGNKMYHLGRIDILTEWSESYEKKSQ